MLTMLLIVAAAIGQTPQSTPEWAKKALSSTRAACAREARRASQEKAPKQLAVITGSQARSASANPLVDPEGEKLRKQLYQGILMVVYLAKRGDLSSALHYYRAFEARFPSLNNYYRNDKVSLEYLTGDVNGAYADIVDEFSEEDRGQDKPWLLLAAVCAAKGQVFPGELEYCRGAIESTIGWTSYRTRALPGWSPRSPKDVEASGCVALFESNQAVYPIPILERARRLCPANQAIADELLDMYRLRGQFSKFRTLAQAVLAHFPSEQEHRRLEAYLSQFRGKPDKPPIKPVFDDGGA